MSSTALRHVGWCSGVAASAHQALREAAVAARDSGDSISAIADAAGTTRQTIYRWIAQTGEAGGSPVATIRAAMTMLAGYLPGNQASQVMARTGGDIDMKAEKGDITLTASVGHGEDGKQKIHAHDDGVTAGGTSQAPPGHGACLAKR